MHQPRTFLFKNKSLSGFFEDFARFPADPQHAIDALNTFTTVANLRFEAATSAGDAQLLVGMGSSLSGGALGWSYLPQNGVTRVEMRFWAPFANGEGVSPGTNAYSVFVHEFGHALGLHHSAGFPGASDWVRGTNGLNQEVFSVMSYNTGWNGVANGAYQAVGPMAFDIAALQLMYGANATTASGNDTYLFDEGNRKAQCIWDTGGNDSIVYGGDYRVHIDLRAATIDNSPIGGGAISYLTDDYGKAAGSAFTIAQGVVIENATGGSNDDYLLGNSTANVLIGGNGNDFLEGDGGNDILIGGQGSDIYVFSTGDGDDRIEDDGSASVADTLMLGVGINAANTKFTRNGNDLTLSWGRDGVTLGNFFATTAYQADSIAFSDGRIWHLNADGTANISRQLDLTANHRSLGGVLATSQSSTTWDGAAQRAVDGEDSSAWSQGSISHTGNGATEFWQLDLGITSHLSRVEIYNRADNCGTRLNGAIVEFLDATGHLLGNASTISGMKDGGYFTVTQNVDARYVRVTHHDQYLSLAEVKVFAWDNPLSGSLTLDGLAKVGQTLTITSTLSDADGMGSLSYQWQASLDGRHWADIDGAMTSSLTIGSELLGKFVRVQATHTDSYGVMERVDSAASDPVAHRDGTPAGVVIDLTANHRNLGGTLIAHQSTSYPGALAERAIDGNSSNLWRSDSISSTNNGSTETWQLDLGGAAHLSRVEIYNRADDCGYRLNGAIVEFLDANGQRVGNAKTISGMGDGGYFTVAQNVDARHVLITHHDQYLSLAEVKVYAWNNQVAGELMLNGSAIQGSALTVDSSGLSDAEGLGPLSYQWQSSADGVHWNDIGDATGASFTLGQAQVGKQLRVQSKYTDGFGTVETILSSVSKPVGNINDRPTGNITIFGSPKQGQILSASHTLGDVDGLGVINWQWYANGSAISGANRGTLMLDQSLVGKYISVVASYTDGFGTNEQIGSAPSAPVAPLPVEINLTENHRGLGGSLAVTQSSTAWGGDPQRAVDGGTSSRWGDRSITHTNNGPTETWQLDLGGLAHLSKVELYNRADGCGDRLNGAIVEFLNNSGQVVGSATTISGMDDGGVFTVSQNIDARYVRVTHHDQYLSLAEVKVYAWNQQALGIVSVEGTAIQGQLLTATTSGLSDPDGLGALHYQWLVAGIGGWHPIEGATQSSYVLTAAEVGKAVGVAVSFTDGFGTIEPLLGMTSGPVAAATTLDSDVGIALPADVSNLNLTGNYAIAGIGNALDNRITGNAASNALLGGLGNDTLTGGAGADHFIFNTALGRQNVDTITDFSIAEGDLIVLDHTIFSRLGIKDNLSEHFRTSDQRPIGNDDYIVLNTETGQVFYDPSGNDSGTSLLFAILANKPEIFTPTQFAVI